MTLVSEHGHFEFSEFTARALPYLSMGQIFLTLGGIVFHASIAPNNPNDKEPTDKLSSMILNNWYTFYYGFSGFDTLFLCCGVLSLITSHLKSICSYSLSIIFTSLSTVSSMFFIYVGEVVRTFSKNTRDYRTNLALSVIGTIVHVALLYMHIERRGAAVNEANAVPRSQLGSKTHTKDVIYLRGRVSGNQPVSTV